MPKPDLTSVRSLVTSVSKLARHLGITSNGVYRWIKVNRIPGAHIIKMANFYDVEIPELLHLTGSDKSNAVTANVKPKDTLKELLEVYKGTRTLTEACGELGISELSGKMVMTHWGDELPTLYTTLVQLEEGRIDLEAAMARLHVSKYTLHGLRRKYGFAPRSQEGYKAAPKKEPKRLKKRDTQKEVALQVISGKLSAQEGADLTGSSYRTIWRCIERLTPVRVNQIADWPETFRAALVVEIDKNLPNYAQKWVEFAEKERLFLKKTTKYPKTPTNWKHEGVKRLLVAVLLGEASLDEIAHARGGEPEMVAGLFTSDLRILGLTFDEVQEMSMAHQLALADLYLAVMDRKRRVV